MKKHYLGAVYEVNKQNMNHLIEQLDEAQSELNEQCRLNGMGQERELKLMAQLDELNRENERLNLYVIAGCETMLDELKRENEKLKERIAVLEVDLLMDQAAAALSDFRVTKQLQDRCDSLAKQNEILKAALNDIENRLLAMSIERGEGNMKRLVYMACETVEKTLAEVEKMEGAK